MRPVCECGNLVEKSFTRVDGIIVWKKMCRTCRGRYRFGIQKGTKCEDCGFVPQVTAQLEIDHIDGDNTNNDKDNLRTLCCNCHALKTYNEKNNRFVARDNPFYGKKTHTRNLRENSSEEQ